MFRVELFKVSDRQLLVSLKFSVFQDDLESIGTIYWLLSEDLLSFLSNDGINTNI